MRSAPIFPCECGKVLRSGARDGLCIPKLKTCLNIEQRSQLALIVRHGRSPAKKFLRARVLLLSVEGDIEHGDALLGMTFFRDFRFGRVFIYHNGAESYYAARGFRGTLRV